MATQGLSVSSIVDVQVSLSATPAQGENVDTMLIVGPSPVIDTTSRMRTYTALSAIGEDFGTTAPEYLASQLWFGQSPQPQNVNIGRWAQTATGAQIIGGALSAAEQALAVWTAITNGGFFFTANNQALSISGLNFSACTNLNGVAAIIQAAIIAAGGVQMAGATVVWDASQSNFQIELPYDVPAEPAAASFLSVPTASGYVTFTGNVNPAANDTLTLNGSVITFVSTAPVGLQVQIGSVFSQTLVSLAALINTSTDTQLSKFTASIGNGNNVFMYLVSKTTGTPGNALTLAKTSTVITISGATLAGGSGTDISAPLGMQSISSGAFVAPGVAAESALTAITLLDNMFSNQWYGLAVCGAADADVIAIASYIEAATVKHYYGVTTSEAAVLTAPGSIDTTSLAYQLMQLDLKKTAIQYSSTTKHAAVSYLARILTTDWQGNNTVITEMFKQEPLVIGETLSATQMANLLAHNCNVFVNYNNKTTIIQPGQSCSGDWTDTIIAADWFAIQIQTDVYDALYTTPTKIPQTDAGMHILATVIEADCIAAVNNGFLAPGVWQTTGFGSISEGSYLPKGYYIYQPLIATQTQAQRATRISVPFQIAAKTAGAVHGANISVTINQ